MMSSSQVLLGIAVMGAITWLLRALPFVAERWLQGHPWVGKVRGFLPTAIMVILLLHTVSTGDASRSNWPIAEVVSIAVVMGLQWFVRHALLSIFTGTGLYVLLVNPSFFGG
jgi:branched-subunit amino acid transport protein AzlD